MPKNNLQMYKAACVEMFVLVLFASVIKLET